MIGMCMLKICGKSIIKPLQIIYKQYLDKDCIPIYKQCRTKKFFGHSSKYIHCVIQRNRRSTHQIDIVNSKLF